jgi:Family of unknown function (DUF5947)
VTALDSRLRGLARGTPEQPAAEQEERCELCGEPIPAQHRHLIDVHDRRLLCACRPCSILFDHKGAGGGHFRLVPNESRRIVDFDMDGALWRAFDIPVELAFFFDSSVAGSVVAFYPAPAGATESLLALDAWNELVRRNPVLNELEPDVEALLVDRTAAPAGDSSAASGGRRRASGFDYWLVPVDRCYELVGVIRTHWRGFGGGAEVWNQIDGFFDRLRREAVDVTNERKETACH